MQNKVSAIILNTARRNLLLSLAILAAVAGAIGAALVPPLVLGRIVDALVNGQAVPLSRIALYFAFIALTGLLESLRESALTVFGQKVTHALRSRLMEKQVRLTADALNRQEPGILVSRFVGDVDTVENLFTSGIISMAADACKLLSILAVVWSCNRGLAYVLLALLPLLFVFTRSVQKRMLAAQLANRKAVGQASGYVPETLHNIRTIHSLGKEGYMEQRYDRAIGESYRAIERTNFYDAVYSPVILTLNAVVVAIVMLLSASGSPAVLTLFGMSAGTAVTVINYISQIFSPVESLGMEIQTIQSAVAGVRRIQEFLDQDELPPQSAAPVKNPQAPFVELRDVTFGYDEQETVLRHLSFQVAEGEQVTLTGRTGAGKSTVFKLLLGLYTPQEGAVLLQGVPVSEIPEAERRKLFGCVEQSFHRVPGTVRDQITLYDTSITEEQVRIAARLAGLEDAINGLERGYDTPCTPALFSQGQWQLLSIARAVAADPKLLLLDEITANLDVETEHAVLLALRRASSNRMVISISHRTGADMGRLIPIGAPADLSAPAAT